MSKKQTRNIKKIARIRDKATEKYLEVIEFPTSESDVSRLELPPSVVNEPGALEKQLRDAGAILPTGLSDRHPKDQFIWPDGERRRSIEIIWPRNPKKKKDIAQKAK
jgi:hypothetical protein